MKHTTIRLFEAGLVLVVITAIHDLTPQRQEGRVQTPVTTTAEALERCSAMQEHESFLTNTNPAERGITSVNCLLKYPNGMTLPLVDALKITPRLPERPR